MALSANKARDSLRSAYDMYHSFPVAASVEIYQGSLVVLHDGYLEPADEAADFKAVGVAQERVTGGASAGDVTCLVRQGIFKFTSAASADLINADDVGDTCYMVDDDVVALTDDSSGRSAAGTIYSIADDGDVYVLVKL